MIDVTQAPYNAKPGSDCTAAINAAIAAAPAGSTLYFPAGAYLLSSSVPINKPLHLLGDGIVRGTSNGAIMGGTVFVCLFRPNIGGAVFIYQAQSITTENIEVTCDYQPSPGPGWAPVPTPWAFSVSGPQTGDTNVGPGVVSDPMFRNVMIRGMSGGIALTKCNRVEIDGLFGQCFGPLLYMDAIYDVARVRNVHSWPFWSLDPNVFAWCRKNVYAIELGRVDAPQFHQVFADIANVGLYLFDSNYTPNTTGVSAGQFTNVSFDDVSYGIVSASTKYVSYLSFSNLFVMCHTNGSMPVGSRCIWIGGSQPVHLTLNGADLRGSDLEAIRVDAAGSVVLASGLHVWDYNNINLAAYPFPAIFNNAGCSVQLGTNLIEGGYGVPALGGPGQFINQ